MNLGGFFALIIDNLKRRTIRVFLTAIGISIGVSSVIIMVSLGISLQNNYQSQLTSIGSLTNISVYPIFGTSPQENITSPISGGSTKLITPSILEKFKAIKGVKLVVPEDYARLSSKILYQNSETYPNLIGVGIDDISLLDLRVESGASILRPRTMIIGYPIQKQFTNPHLRPGQNQPGELNLLNKPIKLIVSRYTSDGIEIKKTLNYVVVGVLPESHGESDYSVYLPINEVSAINDWGENRRTSRIKDGYQTVIIKASETNNILPIIKEVAQLGYQANSPQEYVNGINSFFTLLNLLLGGVGAISLLVAGIGITNTMGMAILERTNEIGLLRALGATRKDILFIFLGESAIIGFIGGLIGVILGWIFSTGLNYIVINLTQTQNSIDIVGDQSVINSTPPWLLFSALLFSIIVGVISGLFPSIEAANKEPVSALKFE
jgi:putative ABC transport system permease protein